MKINGNLKQELAALNRQSSPATAGEWRKHFVSMAEKMGLGEIEEAPCASEAVHVRRCGEKVRLSIDYAFFEKFAQLREYDPELYKTFLLTGLLTAAGNCLARGSLRSDMRALALFVGAENAGYEKKEILEFLALGTALDCLRAGRRFSAHSGEAEKEFGDLFRDTLDDSDIKALFSSAKKLHAKVREELGRPRASRPKEIIDCHVHLGHNFEGKFYTAAELQRDLRDVGAAGAVAFAFPENIYRRSDDRRTRLRMNDYVLKSAQRYGNIIPFYFVWNDYIIPEDLASYRGIKWHRHYDEPKYDYSSKGFHAFLERVKEMRFPVLFEEELEITADFAKKNGDLNIIVPHVGRYSGGYDKVDRFFEFPNIYFDTSTAPLAAIEKVLKNCGAKRLIFGSDISGTKMPFHNYPSTELEKLEDLRLSPQEQALVFSENIKGLIAQVRTPRSKERIPA